MSTRGEDTATPRYRVIESVGPRMQRVRNYEDLEIHHPSWEGREPGRVYATVDGEPEEVLRRRSADGSLLVSKDLILLDERTGSSRVPVPAPAAGVIGRVDATSGIVTILERTDGPLVAQLRHMDLRGSGLAAEQPVVYGQPLGLQSGFGGGSPRRYGIHVHIDFNVSHLDQFKRYVADLDSGALPIPAMPQPSRGNSGNAEPRHESRAAPAVLETGDRGAAVAQLQRALNRFGATAALIPEDGDFGLRTRQAVEAFQRVQGLEVDGRAGPATADALERAQRTLPSHASHPAHARFHEALDAVHAMERRDCRQSGAHSERLAAAVTLAALERGLARIDRVELNDRGTHARAVEVSAVRDEPTLNRTTPPIATADALRVPLREAASALEAAVQPRTPFAQAPLQPEPIALEQARLPMR